MVFIAIFLAIFLGTYCSFPSFLFSKFFWSIFFFRAPGSDPRWSGVDSNLCVLKFHSPGAWPPPKVPTKKIPNTTQLLVNDGKHYFRVGSLSSNFKSLENGPGGSNTKKPPPSFCFFGVPGVPRCAPSAVVSCSTSIMPLHLGFCGVFVTSAKRTKLELVPVFFANRWGVWPGGLL